MAAVSAGSFRVSDQLDHRHAADRGVPVVLSVGVNDEPRARTLTPS